MGEWRSLDNLNGYHYLSKIGLTLAVEPVKMAIAVVALLNAPVAMEVTTT
ncbi:MAG: hypothetical protein VKJ27_06275 [Synechocystis sp.]|nr:hypothetical protein [Synechocystis sp.]